MSASRDVPKLRSVFGETEENLASVVDFMPGSKWRTEDSLSDEQEWRPTQFAPFHVARELMDAAAWSRELILQHRLYRSARAGQIIHIELLRLALPPRWTHNILRTLDYLRSANLARDPGMEDALAVPQSKRLCGLRKINPPEGTKSTCSTSSPEHSGTRKEFS